MDDLVPVHIGLCGHIDHGKTELARVLSDEVYTAGLDKHPQAQKRGITIDLGFTMFRLEKYLVTLVDAPGHADLIRSVVAAASIIDAAILVVAADEGPKIQTGEHIVALKSLGVEKILVTITKTDLVDEKHLRRVEEMTMRVVEEAGYAEYRLVKVSAKKMAGIDGLKSELEDMIVPRERDPKGPFLMPIDHAFPVRGHGTVITGTALRGQIETGSKMQIMPQAVETRIRSIQTFSKERKMARAGDRIGVNVLDISYNNISRGDYLCKPGSIEKTRAVYVQLERNPFYKGRVTKGMVVSATVGMPTMTTQIIPFQMTESGPVVLEVVDQDVFMAALLFKSSLVVEPTMRVLLMRTDLPPTEMRIVGAGKITDVPASVRLMRRKTRRGKVSRVREADVLVEGLASTKAVAKSLVGEYLMSGDGTRGRLQQPFGTKGVISAVFDSPVSLGDVVVYERYTEEEYEFGRRR